MGIKSLFKNGNGKWQNHAGCDGPHVRPEVRAQPSWGLGRALVATGPPSPQRTQGWQVWELGTGEPGSRLGEGQGKGSQNVLKGVVPASHPRWALGWEHKSEPETGPREAPLMVREVPLMALG